MANAMLGWDNAILTATLNAPSEAAGLGASNLTLPQGDPASAWQTAAGVTTAILNIDTGSAASVWDMFAVSRSNLTNSAQVRWWVGNDNTFATYNWFGQTSPKNGQAITVVSPIYYSGRYALLNVIDAGNTDNFINIPLIYAGPAWRMTGNISMNSTFGIDDGTVEVVTRSGSEFPDMRWQRRRWEIATDSARTSDVWPNIMDCDAIARTGQNVLFVPDPVSSYISNESVFGRLKSTSDVGFFAPTRRSWKARITERL